MSEDYIPYIWRHKPVPEVYTYSSTPQLRVRLAKMLSDTIGASHSSWSALSDAICRELGYENNDSNYTEQWLTWHLLTEPPSELVFLSVLEMACRQAVDSFDYLTDPGAATTQFSDRINEIFDQHDVGYQFENGTILRRDSQFVHAQLVKPVLALLTDPRFASVNNEFMTAHTAYRNQDFKTSNVECLKALESTMKIICTDRKWAFDAKANASKLIATIMSNGLIPSHLQTLFSGIKNTLSDGIPTIRNQGGGHGQGATIVQIPASLAGYQIGLTATAIAFLVRLDQELP